MIRNDELSVSIIGHQSFIARAIERSSEREVAIGRAAPIKQLQFIWNA